MRFASTLALLAIFSTPAALLATPISVSGTGVGTIGSVDPSYTVFYTGNTVSLVGTPGPAYIFAQGPYTAPAAGTQYISTQDGSSAAGGYFVFTTTFTLSAANFATANLFGQFAADNAATVYLNGVDTGFHDIYGTDPSNYGFASLTSYNLTSGFVAGVNTLQFIVQNGNFDGDTTGPMALDASAAGTVTTEVAPVPEPSSLAFLGTGLITIMGYGRRKLRA